MPALITMMMTLLYHRLLYYPVAHQQLALPFTGFITMRRYGVVSVTLLLLASCLFVATAAHEVPTKKAMPPLMDPIPYVLLLQLGLVP